jgi:hypothetical protein
MFSASRDTDFLIMEEMDDESLLNFCKVNLHTFTICNNDLFWEKRSKRNFEELSKLKPENESWKRFYLNILYYIYKLKEDFKYEYEHGEDEDTPETVYNRVKASVDDKLKLKLETPLPRGKVYDVSFIYKKSRPVKIIKRPDEDSDKKQLGDLNIYSDNFRSVSILRGLIGNYDLKMKRNF